MNQRLKVNLIKCNTSHLAEEEIKEKFIIAYSKLMEDKTRIIKDTKEVITLLTDTSKLEMELAYFNSELDIVNGLVEKLVQENQRKV